MKILNGNSVSGLNELVFFPFDDHSLPFQKGVKLNLKSFAKHRGNMNIVMGLGPEGSPDCKIVSYYGSVSRVEDQYRMWYLGQGSDPSWHQRICLATSWDGLTWDKPDLGLVAYNGNKRNNLVDLNEGRHHVQACVVFHDPDDPEPRRRFKMAFEAGIHDNRLAVAFSEDGLRWKESPNNPVGDWLEMAGGTIYNGCFFVNGQGGVHSGRTRQFATHFSYDFEHWIDATCLSMRRSNEYSARTPFAGDHEGEQVHLGAALWNRGNVILGIYGMWNGHPTNDRRLVSMDLGLAVSMDGLHFREPIPNFPIVRAAEAGFPRANEGPSIVQTPALIQGQGFENIGDKTFFWYGRWPENNSDGVRAATWDRDRLGYFTPFLGDRMQSCRESFFISSPIDLEGDAARVFVNLEGVSEHAGIEIEIVDEQFRTLSSYRAEECISLESGGLREPIAWETRDSITCENGKVRLKVGFRGLRAEDIKIYALYLEAVK